MNKELTVLCEAFELVTGRQLTDPSLDMFDLGLDSIDVLSLLSRLHHAGYRVTVEDLMGAESMSAVAGTMTGLSC